MVKLTPKVQFQFYQALNCRSETESILAMHPLSNPFLFFSMVAALFAHLAVLYAPALQFVFRTVPLTARQWFEVAVISSVIVVVVEADKLWQRRRRAFPHP